MRTSNPQIDTDTLVKEFIDSGKEILVADWKGGNHMKVRSLKRLNRMAYDTHLVEVEMGGVKGRFNIEDIRSALKYT
jgi:hypothetical protein